jgi:hypothetical protein
VFWRYYGHFAYLAKNIEEMFVTGEAQYPAERTLLTSGALEAALDGRFAAMGPPPDSDPPRNCCWGPINIHDGNSQHKISFSIAFHVTWAELTFPEVGIARAGNGPGWREGPRRPSRLAGYGVGQRRRPAWRAAGDAMARVAMDVKVILKPPCIFH